MGKRKNQLGNRFIQTRSNLTTIIPGLVKLTEADRDFPWASIDRLFEDTWIKKSSTAINDTFKVEATFFFTLMAALKGLSTAVGYVEYLNRTMGDLAGRLNDSQKKMLGSTIKKLLKTPTLQFLNFAGELAALNSILRSNPYQLEKVESPLGNDNSIDFRFKDERSGTAILVEVLNIHLDDEKVESDPAAIETFLSGRLVKKIAKKEKELAGEIPFWLLPVVWGNARSIEIYQQHFQGHNIAIDRALEPLAYLQHSDDNGFYFQQFNRVSRLQFPHGLTAKAWAEQERQRLENKAES